MNPALTPKAFCILAMRTADDNFAAGFLTRSGRFLPRCGHASTSPMVKA